MRIFYYFLCYGSRIVFIELIFRVFLFTLLFLLFVNELPAWIKNMIMFPDDTKDWCRFKTETDSITLQLWSDTWQLKFNTEKCGHIQE